MKLGGTDSHPSSVEGSEEEANAGHYAPGTFRRFIEEFSRSRIFRLGLVGGAAGFGAYAIHENLPAIERTYHDVMQGLGVEVVVPSIFDNKAEKVIIGANNIIRMTAEDAEQQGLLTPQFNPETEAVTVFSPLILPNNTSATIDKTPYIVRGIEHQDERNIVPTGTKIVSPKGGRVMLIRGFANQGQDQNLAYDVSFSWYDEKNNVTISWGLYPLNGGLKTDLPLQDQPIKGISEIDYEKLPVSDGKTPVATTTVADTLHIAGAIYAGKSLSAENYRGQIKDLNYVTQNGKLLVLEPS